MYYMGAEIPHQKGQIWCLSGQLKTIGVSLLRQFLQQKINNVDS